MFHPLPLPAERLSEAVTAVVTTFRHTSLPQAGIGPSVPVHICENDRPTGQDRTERRQAEVIEQVLRGLAALRADLNLTGYSFFDLRDANSASTELFDRFGLLHDDYTPKPAFDTYRRLIHAFSA
ncbi:hypothetical protein ACIRP0_14070 [Streptomyces sp. NPDC101733]|uniref:hypothetical protein n=1 Tax=unclassified Streptomyces TaxID=2593676 RepID=UPI0037F4A8C8